MEKTKQEKKMSEVKTNPLTNERIFVRFVPHEKGYVGSNKAHVLYGGKADGTTTTFCVPMLRSTGNYKNILTDNEKEFLERELGLDGNALSVYRKENNYWDNYRVIVPKEGMYLDLSNPEDYIRYKVLIANTDIVAPSVQERINRPMKTYQFEIVREKEEASVENAKMDATMASYEEFRKLGKDMDTMRVLVEILDARPYAQNTGYDFLRSRVNSLIQANPNVFLNAITDPLLHTKVLIRRGVELGKISKRGDYYFLAGDGKPLSDGGENPTLSIAAEYLNLPAHQDIKFILESEVEKNKA